MNVNSPTGYQILIEGLAALERERGRPLAINFSEDEARRMTVEAARETLAYWRKQAEQGLI